MRSCSGRRALLERLEHRQLLAAAPGFASAEYAVGLTQPTAFALASDGRLFVTEQGGTLRVVRDGQALPQAALALEVDSQGERGLIGIALDPNFAATGHLYLHYTTETPTIHNRVSRFTVTGDAIDPASEQVLIDLPTLSGATNHNGGAIHFGTDGKLYIAVGDNANPDTAQPLTTVLGKMLRLNADGTIPDDNPFFDETTGQNQAIWARGLRNPYTFAVRSDGRIHINDVGQSAFEEVNLGVAGGNYGWPLTEGKRTSGQSVPQDYVDPLLAYDRSGGTISGPSIAGAAFYEAPDGATNPFPATFDGDYLFSDWGSGFVATMDVASRSVTPLATGLSGPVDLTVAPDGSLYVLEYAAGRITRLSSQPADLAVTLVQGPKQSGVVQLDRDRVKVRIENLSTTRFDSPVNIELQLLGTGSTAGETSTLAVKSRRINLNPGRGVSVVLPYQYTADVAGERLVGVRLVAPEGEALDAEATNNLATSSPVQIAAATNDLSPQFPGTSFSFTAGRGHRVQVDLRNLGSVKFTGEVELSLALSPQQGGGETLALVTRTIRRSIAAQDQKRVVLPFRLPADLPAGSYDLTASLVASGELIDADPSNDVGTTDVTIS